METIDFLKEMAESGIHFEIYVDGNGCACLGVEEVLKYISNRDKFLAEFLGISVNTLKLWREFYKEHGRCRAKTKRGQRCLNGCPMVEPQNFNPNIDWFCRVHSRLG